MELKNFNNCISAFINFKDGGWWLEKYEEEKELKILGPYSNKEKEKNEGKKEINFLSYYQLIKKYTLDDKLWKPPYGAPLLLLINDKIDVCYLENKIDKAFKFAIDNGLLYIKSKNNLTIFYKNNPQSFFSAKEIYNYLLDNDNTDYLNKIIFKERNFFNKEHKHYYTPEDFKGMSLEKLVKSLKKTLEVNKIYFQHLEDNTIEWRFNIKILKDNEDMEFKNLIFKYKEFLNEGEMIFQNKYLFKFKDNFSQFLEIYILNNGEINENDFQILIKILRNLKVKKIKIKDNNYKECKGFYINENIIYNLANMKNIFEKLGMRREDYGRYKLVISKYKNLKIKELDEKVLYNNYTISEIALLYIRSKNKYRDLCEIAAIITSLIGDEITEKSKYYKLNL